MRILIPGFTGLNLRLAPQRLEDTEATVSVNCDYRTGDLRGYLGDQATGLSTGSKTAPSSLFKVDNNLLVTAGAYDFVRSPTFYSNQASNRRIFYTQYPGTGDWRPYQMESSAITNGGGLPGIPTRLGVPAPAYKPDTPVFAVQSGDIVSVEVFSRRAKQTDRDTLVTTTSAHHLKTGDKVVVDYPGVLPQATTITVPAGFTAAFRLNGTARDYKDCQIKLVRNADASTLVGIYGAAAAKLALDQQIILETVDKDSTHRAIAALGSNFPQGARWRVATVPTKVDATTPVLLQQLDDSGNNTADWAPTTTGTYYIGGSQQDSNHNNRPAAFFLLSYADNPMQTVQSRVRSPVMLSGGGEQFETLWDDSVTVNDYASGQWANAATVDTVRDRAYLYTYVNAYGDESAPSEATPTYSVVPGSDVTFPIGAFRTLVQTDPKYPDPVLWRVYRTDALGTWRFLLDIPYNATASPEKTENILDTALGETLTTEGWRPPPDQMTGLISAPNGVIVGFREKTILPSVPYAPYAFPLAYQQSVDYDIVGLVSTAAGIAVLTKGMPYLLIGTDPASWAVQKLEVPQACVSHASIVDMGDFGIYASPDGLVAIEGSTVKVITQDLLTRAQWQGYNPSTIVAAQGEGRYIATWQPASGPRKGFIFDPVTGAFTDTDNTAVAFYNDLLTDSLYQLLPDGSVTSWNHDSTYQSSQRRSKLFQMPRPTNFAACPVLIRDYTATTTIQIYADGVPLFVNGSQVDTPRTLTDAAPFRLPGGFYAKDYQVKLQGTGWVQAVGIANAVDELKEAP